MQLCSAPSADGVVELVNTAAAVDWVRDAFAHLKAIGFQPDAQPLLDEARVKADNGVISLAGDGLDTFIEIAKEHRIWTREPAVRK